MITRGTRRPLPISSPLTLWFRRTLLPIFNYANNATGGGDVYSYSLEFAPHHLGVWPVCAMKEEDQENMPVEESSNMLIMLAALAKVQGSDSVEYLKPYIGMLKQWADFNIGVLPDPGDQLCTDDFEGPSPHNVNLAAKGIVSLGAFGQLLGVMGDEDGASHYRGIAEELVGNWTSMGVEGGHSKLQVRRASEQSDAKRAMRRELCEERGAAKGGTQTCC